VRVKRAASVFRSTALGALLVVSTSGCLEGRSFHRNSGLRITEPIEGDFVEAPLTIHWVSPNTSVKRFAVFVDRPPLAPGKSVDKLEVQEREGVFLTSETEFLLEFVAPRDTSVEARRDLHQITVVALTADGKRIDDSSTSVKLTVVEP
jgi:hypothetical protein